MCGNLNSIKDPNFYQFQFDSDVHHLASYFFLNNQEISLIYNYFLKLDRLREGMISPSSVVTSLPPEVSKFLSFIILGLFDSRNLQFPQFFRFYLYHTLKTNEFLFKLILPFLMKAVDSGSKLDALIYYLNFMDPLMTSNDRQILVDQFIESRESFSIFFAEIDTTYYGDLFFSPFNTLRHHLQKKALLQKYCEHIIYRINYFIPFLKDNTTPIYNFPKSPCLILFYDKLLNNPPRLYCDYYMNEDSRNEYMLTLHNSNNILTGFDTMSRVDCTSSFSTISTNDNIMRTQSGISQDFMM